MKKIVLQTSIEVFPDLAALAPADRELMDRARRALQHSHSPYSGFRVGAALRLVNGAVLGGSNQENAAYPMCLCAERVVLAAAAVQYPGVAAESMAITAHYPGKELREPISPCGACRQVICEVEQQHGQTMRILLRGDVGEVFVLAQGRDLLPLGFGGGVLER
ncbi:MAG: cytidine deaminase [Bacteroidota bacterium]